MRDDRERERERERVCGDVCVCERRQRERERESERVRVREGLRKKYFSFCSENHSTQVLEKKIILLLLLKIGERKNGS